MSTESVNTSPVQTQAPVQAQTQAPRRVPKQFNELEELGFKLSNYIRLKYPLPEGVNFMVVHEPIFNETFDIRRKGSKVFVSIHKNPIHKNQNKPKTNPNPN